MEQRVIAVLAIFLFFAGFLFVHFSYPCAQEKPQATSASPSGKGEEIPDWVARWELARALSYAKRYDESVSEYKKILKERPDLVKAKTEMAKVLFWQGKKQEAAAILETLKPDQTDDESKLLMADLYVVQKSYKKAAPLYRAYLEKHPGNHGVRLKLAEVLSWDKQYEASLKEYRQILTALPEDIQVRRKYAFVLMWSKRYDEAANELRKTLK